jgi:anti-sigma factor RsiW
MNAPTEPITELELHAYIDGELPPDRQRAVVALLERDPALAQRAAAFMADKQRLAAAFGPIAGQPLPAAWIARIRTAPRPRRVGPADWRAIAASVLLCCGLGGGGAWLLRPPADTILADAERAHDDAAPGAALPPAGARDDGLRATLGLKVRAPDLAALGYRLTGVRVLTLGAGGHAAELVYQDAHALRLTIYVRKSAGAARFDLLRRGRLRVCIWQDDVVGAVITGEMSAGAMMRVASRAYADLDL